MTKLILAALFLSIACTRKLDISLIATDAEKLRFFAGSTAHGRPATDEEILAATAGLKLSGDLGDLDLSDAEICSTDDKTCIHTPRRVKEGSDEVKPMRI